MPIGLLILPALYSLNPLIIKLGSILTSIIGLGFLITIHELGHFLMCKLCGVRTPQFSIGFGPTLLSKKIGDTLFVLAAIPLGGFVEIAGAAEVGQGEQLSAHDTSDSSFLRKPYYQKLLILLGGILFNILFAYVALIGLCYTGSQPTPLLYPLASGQTITRLLPESSAAQAGLKEGDRITTLNDIPTSRPGLLLTGLDPQSPLTVTVESKGQAPRTLTLAGLDARLDIRFETASLPPAPSLLAAIRCGIHITNFYLTTIASAFYGMIKHRQTSGLGGPVRILAETSQGLAQGFSTFLIILALLSLNLAIFNLLPLPILDGGQVVLYTFEALAGRPLSSRIKTGIHMACWVLVMIFFVLVTIKDTISLIW